MQHQGAWEISGKIASPIWRFVLIIWQSQKRDWICRDCFGKKKGKKQQHLCCWFFFLLTWTLNQITVEVYLYVYMYVTYVNTSHLFTQGKSYPYLCEWSAYYASKLELRSCILSEGRFWLQINHSCRCCFLISLDYHVG